MAYRRGWQGRGVSPLPPAGKPSDVEADELASLREQMRSMQQSLSAIGERIDAIGQARGGKA